MLALHLASTNLVSANSVCKCGNGDVNTPSKKVVDYNVGISESGEQYNETIEVDTEKQTELFKVPAHRDVDQSNILHDFKMTSDKKVSETRNIEHKWTVGSEVTDRSVLSDELANFCAKYPIYNVKKMEDTLKTARIQTGDRKSRNRRQRVYRPQVSYVDLEEWKCPGKKGTVTNLDFQNCVVFQKKQWKVVCKNTTTCYNIVECPTFDYCHTVHRINRTFCCQYVCK